MHGKSKTSLLPNDESVEGMGLTPLEGGFTRFNDEGMLLYERTEENSMLLAASAFEDSTLSNTTSPVKRAANSGQPHGARGVFTMTRRDLRTELQLLSSGRPSVEGPHEDEQKKELP